jgi:eukaryotic-like serine/threonine-protein kinase
VRLGPYEILSALGAGGMGEVYKARDTRLERVVAIKVLPESFAGDPQFRERFDREARAISQLTHPHICTLYDVGEQQGTAYLVMELLDGETLADRLTKGALPLDQTLRIAIEIADALDAAHHHGIVHRDLKPGNVMLTKAGAKLLDFGLAKSAGPAIAGAGLSMIPTTPPHITAQGTILGTFQYMAPEQLEGQDVDARTDIFAFGVVLYEMLTGRKAFAGKTHASLIGAILKDFPPPVSTVQPLSPRSLDRVVSRCLEKDPDNRWQTTRDLLAELKWLAGPGVAEIDPGVSGSARRAAQPAGWRRALPWTMVGVFGVALAFALAISTTMYFRQTSVEQVITRFEVATPPTTDSYSFALSPDGRQVTFVANGEKGSQLWVRSLDKVAAQPIAGTGGAFYPFWSPDSQTIGFFSGAGLSRIDVAGGAPQVLIPGGGFFRGGAWNRDGVIVLGDFNGPLKRVSATGGTQAPLTQLAPGQIGHISPQFLPDGHHLIFFATGQQSGVYVASLDGGTPTWVVAAEGAALYASPGFLLRVAQGVLVAQRFDAARGAVLGEPIPVAQGVGSDRSRSAPSPCRRACWLIAAG